MDWQIVDAGPYGDLDWRTALQNGKKKCVAIQIVVRLRIEMPDDTVRSLKNMNHK